MEKIFLIFPVLYVIELIFGFSGTLVMISGLAIRQVLYILTFLSLYMYCAYDIFYLKRVKFKNVFDFIKREISTMELIMVILIFFSFLSMTFIPFINNVSLQLAKAEFFDSFLVLLLYFPLRYLFANVLNYSKLKKLLYYLIFIFAIFQLSLYIGEKSQTGFIQLFFDLIKYVFPNSIQPEIILGYQGSPRVYFTTSVFLVLELYFLICKSEKFKIVDFFILFFTIGALLATFSRAYWISSILAYLLYILYMIFKSSNKKELFIKFIKQILIVGVISLSYDTLLFDGSVLGRISNSFVFTGQEVNEFNNEQIEEITDPEVIVAEENQHFEAAALSNDIRIEQSKYLIEKWLEKPIFGFGYGSYVENYLRSEVAPFSYEMQLFALLMKTGIFGVGLWLLSFGFSLKNSITNKKLDDAGSYIFLFFSILVSMQMNPLFLSYIGMTIIIFIIADSQIKNKEG